MAHRRVAAFSALTLVLAVGPALAAPPDGLREGPHVDGRALLEVLGPRAARVFAPRTGAPAALVRLPEGQDARALGLEPAAPGIGRMRATPERLLAFGRAHPELRVEVAPPLRLLGNGSLGIRSLGNRLLGNRLLGNGLLASGMLAEGLLATEGAIVTEPGPGQWVRAASARAEKGVTGKGVLVGVADTGVDVTHPDLLDESGRTRVAWLLDLSRAPAGKYPELEERYGIKDASGRLVAGAVLASDDIDKLIATKKSLPSDEVGHGTHVASIATARGVSSSTGFVGIAPEAKLVFARVTRAGTESIENADLLAGVAFMFDRADAAKAPIVVNLSVGTDFGPHDGSMLWEQTLASYVGPDKPGRALVVAAGNSGSIADGSVHESVYVTPGARTRVPIRVRPSVAGSIQVWVTTRPNAELRIGLEAPSGDWIAPIGPSQQRGKVDKDGKYTAGVVHGSDAADSPVPDGSRGAVVLWNGEFEGGDYYVTFEGRGTADLWLQAGGDAYGATFVGGVREGTVNLPAAHPSIIAVGCTVDRPTWTSIAEGPVSIVAPVLDLAGGRAEIGAPPRRVVDGEICWFSSAGPNANGVPKPEIAAPGAGVVASMSVEAAPPAAGSIFTVGTCPVVKGARDPRCLQVDDLHAVAVGTSMSAPHVSGAIALLFERDPTLTQDKVVSLLQAGAHRFRAPLVFFDQSGPGELDVLGSLEALDAMHDPKLALPVRSKSWVVASRSFLPADGSAPLTAIVELRAEDGLRPADLFDRTRLRAVAKIAGRDLEPVPEIVRKAPGVFTFVVQPPAGLGGYRLELAATFDGEPIVDSIEVPIATDPWMAAYPARAVGGCTVATPPSTSSGLVYTAMAALGAVVVRRARRRHSGASVTR